MIRVDPMLLKDFCFWGSILVLKMFAVVALIGRQRFSKKIFANPEDITTLKDAKVAHNDPDVERCRRAHLNDLENIPIWFIITFFYLDTAPSVWLASILIKTFVLARIVHTLVYAVYPQQPLRAISFFVGVAITVYQTVVVLLYFS